MNLDCLNDIITDNLAIQIDLTELDSWDLNTGLTAYSLTKWSGAQSDNLNLIDFGLTEFDNGRTNEMWSGITLTPSDTLFSMYRVGYNVVQNPTTGETSGMTITTEFLPMSGITSGDTGFTGNYYELAGGYLQGFFKLDGYKYELLPARYNNGVTIETLIYLYPDSQGIFYMMGARAEDKYNPLFTGETLTGGTTDNVTVISGVTTSEDNYLEALMPIEIHPNAFANYEEQSTETVYREIPQSANTANNVIAFEITQDKKLAYKYINEKNQIITNKSIATINPTTGWTMIAIAFTPNETIDDPDMIECAAQRKGKFIMYVNGRAIWILNDFPEYFFKAFNNDREKQIGVPYSMSWGGGSFGLKNSWHYDLQTYGIYTGEDQTYIDMNFAVESTPDPTVCDPFTGGTPLEGLSLSADSSTFKTQDICDPSIEYPVTVMRVEYTGGTTGSTGASANTYFIQFTQPIVVLSNREYVVNFNLYNGGFFNTYNNNDFFVQNTVSTFIYGTEDVDIIDESIYAYPLSMEEVLNEPEMYNLHTFPDRQEDQYEYIDGISYYGDTGLPVITDASYYEYMGLNGLTEGDAGTTVVTGTDTWLPMKTTFKVKDNSGKHIVYIGLLIETNYEFNLNEPLFISDFTYTGADILSQDPRKDNLLIQQNFDSYFNGKIQKLRVYDNGLTSAEILHNALIESKANPNANMLVSKGGRIIYA